MSKTQNIISWVLRVVVAAILIQTLYFKFSAHPGSVELFELTGLGSPGRIGIGVLELIAAILILIPKTAWAGSGLAAGLMSGAIFFHLTVLGIDYAGDGGALFIMALVVFTLSLITLWTYREEIPFIGDKF